MDNRLARAAEAEPNQSQQQRTEFKAVLSTTIKKHPGFKNTVIATTLTAWWKALKLTHSTTAPCKYTPIWHNPDFHIHTTPIHYHTWEQKGITHLRHLFHNNKFITYTQLCEQYQLNNNNTFKYLQIKSVIQSKINVTNNPLNPPQLFENIKNFKNHKKLISKLYQLINSDDTIHTPINTWNTDLNTSLTHENWIQICKNTFNMTYSTKLQLIQYKVIHRTHITQYKKHKMGLTDTDTCTQCTTGVTDTHLHALWECTPVKSFWNTITQTLSNILSCRVPPTPSLCLLGLIPHTVQPQHNASLLTSLTIAKRVILQNWKSKQSITLSQWINSLRHHISHTYTTSYDDMASFTGTWSPFTDYLNINLSQHLPTST